MTNKQKLFVLFDKGLSPSSPEVKTIGLKSATRATYFWEWQRERGVKKGKTTLPGGESIGGIDEGKNQATEAVSRKATEANPPKVEGTISQEIPGEESEEPDVEPVPDEEQEPDVAGEEPDVEAKDKESVGELRDARGKDGKKGEEAKGKGEVTIVAEGIKCVVYLSLQTLTLHEIAAARQKEISKNGEAKLTLGDYLDACSEAFFEDRKLKLGLVEIP